MAAYLWRYSKRRLLFGVLLLILGVGLVAFMPSQWEERMASIAEYDKDTWKDDL